MKITRKDFLSQASAAALGPALRFAGAVQPSGSAANGMAPGALSAFDVKQYGARGDGKTIDTRAIQAAIDATGRRGGLVYLPPGEYVSGTIRLRDFTTLYIAAGATLIGSAAECDFDARTRNSTTTPIRMRNRAITTML